MWAGAAEDAGWCIAILIAMHALSIMRCHIHNTIVCVCVCVVVCVCVYTYQRFLNISVNVEKGWLGKSHLFKRPFRTRTPFSWRTIQMLRNSNPCKIPSPPPSSPPPTFVMITRIHNFEIFFFRISPHLDMRGWGQSREWKEHDCNCCLQNFANIKLNT